MRGTWLAPWRLAIAVAVALTIATSLAGADPRIDALGTDDPRALTTAVADIEQLPTTPELADALFAAARATEDRLLDPARALALYERILRELPDARVATAARRRADRLRADVGAHGEHARLAAQLAELIAHADQLPADEITRRGEALATAAWPRAPDAALWLAELARRQRRFAEAQRRYAEVVARWPGSEAGIAALRGGAGNAIDARQWGRAEALIAQLPTSDAAQVVLRDDLTRAVRDGRLRARLHTASWVVVVLAGLLLLASLLEAVVRGGVRAPSPRPPFEVWFLAPVATVLVAVGYTGNLTVAPAVLTIAVGGLVLVWLSGATLDLLRVRSRPVRARAIAHVVICLAGAIALGYLALTRDGLIDMLVETVRFGPDR